MKHRWIGGAVLASALALAACAPQNQGGDATEGPTDGASSPTATPTVQPATPDATESPTASETPAPTPDDYEY